MTTTALAALPVDELERLVAYAERLAAADLLPAALRRRPANLLLVLEYGRALGLPPAAAIQQVAVVDGRPQITATLAATLARRAGHRLRVSADDEQATAELVRADDPEHVFAVSWDLARAERAGLAGRGAWRQYPRAMLTARATLEVVRLGAPEVLVGMHGVEELGDVPPAESLADPAQPPTEVDIDAPPAPDYPLSERPTPAALARLADALTAAGHGTPEAMRTAVSGLVGRRVAHAGELSAGEVDRLAARIGEQ